MLKIIAQFGRLLRPCLVAVDGKAMLCLFILAVILNLTAVYAGVRMTLWSGDFYTAIEKIDTSEVVRQLVIFAIIVSLNSVRGLAHDYIRKVIEIRWRRSLTDHALDLWLRDKNYWYLINQSSNGEASNGTSHGASTIDNPDQRIAEDCALFIKGILGQILDLTGKIAGIFSYVALLWGLANFPLVLPLGGWQVEIPRYMVWSAFLYVFISSVFTHILGRPLKKLLCDQQRYEADFRFAMARWRGAFDEVALSGGEAVEREIFTHRFCAIARNWHVLVNRELILGTFTYPFRHTVLRIPLFIALPAYLAGHIAFGGLMQLSVAFSNVVTTLSWFIFSYRSLADLVATSTRLHQFLHQAQQARIHTQTSLKYSPPSEGQSVGFSALHLYTPRGRKLLENQSLTIKQGESLWLCGASGLGKTTLVKTLAGLWPYATGHINWPAGETLFLPQKPYFPAGNLLQAAAYPAKLDDMDEEKLRHALALVGLGPLLLERKSDKGIDKETANHSRLDRLSGGERQRLALARLLVHCPQWAVLDEATSALDAKAEAEIFAILRNELPHTGFLIIAHRRPHGLAPLRKVDLA